MTFIHHRNIFLIRHLHSGLLLLVLRCRVRETDTTDPISILYKFVQNDIGAVENGNMNNRLYYWAPLFITSQR